MKTLTSNQTHKIALGALIFTVGIVLATTFGNWIVAAMAAFIGFGTYSGVFTGPKSGALSWAIAVTALLLWLMFNAGAASLMSTLALSVVLTVVGGVLIGAGDKARDKAKTAIVK